MIKERGQVSKIEVGGVWVNTIAQSTCDACQAKHGCGQKLLNQIGVPTSSIWASTSSSGIRDLREGEWVDVGVEEGAVVLGSLLAYGLPILMLVIGAALGQDNAALAFTGAALGLVIGALTSRVVLRNYFGSQFFQPVVLGRSTDAAPVNIALS